MTFGPVPAAGLAFAIAATLPIALQRILRRTGAIDVPNPRSSHTTPALRGGGIAQAVAIAVSSLFVISDLRGDNRNLLIVVLCVGVILATLGWIEDVRGVGVGVRGGTELLVGLAASTAGALSTGHPAWWGLVGGVAVVGGTNVVNFMDGVNGISSFHAVLTGVVFIIVGRADHADWLIASGAILAASYAAFLPWNLNGRMFLGDVGSFLLGGTIAISIAFAWMGGASIVALSAPMAIYVADTSITLAGRLSRREPVHQAHRDHTYQRLNRVGHSHLSVSLLVVLSSSICAAAGIGVSRSSGVERVGYWSAIVAIIAAYTFLRFSLGRRLREVAPPRP